MLERISDIKVPMTTDESVEWECYGNGIGTMYVPAGTNRATCELLRSSQKDEQIGEGVYGAVYTLNNNPELVVKEFRGCDNPGHDGLAGLRANISLATGLDRVTQTDERWNIRGVKILGAFVCKSLDLGRTRWLMERVEPVSYVCALDGPLRFLSTAPNYATREALYERAMNTTGWNEEVEFDDHPKNLLVEKTPGSKPWTKIKGSLVKIDIHTNEFY